VRKNNVAAARALSLRRINHHARVHTARNSPARHRAINITQRVFIATRANARSAFATRANARSAFATRANARSAFATRANARSAFATPTRANIISRSAAGGRPDYARDFIANRARACSIIITLRDIYPIHTPGRYFFAQPLRDIVCRGPGALIIIAQACRDDEKRIRSCEINVNRAHSKRARRVITARETDTRARRECTRDRARDETRECADWIGHDILRPIFIFARSMARTRRTRI